VEEDASAACRARPPLGDADLYGTRRARAPRASRNRPRGAYRGSPRGHRVRRPERHRARRPQLWRHRRDRGCRPRSAAHRATRVPRRLRAARRPGTVRFGTSRTPGGDAQGGGGAGRGLAHSAQSCARGYLGGRSRLDPAAPRDAATCDLRAAAAPARRGRPPSAQGAADHLPRSYIYCLRPSPGDVFAQFAERARSEPGWRLYEIDATHSPNVTAPEVLADLLAAIAKG